MPVHFECIWKERSPIKGGKDAVERFHTFPSEEVTNQAAEDIVFVAKLENKIIGTPP
jgi:hypothetical protein